MEKLSNINFSDNRKPQLIIAIVIFALLLVVSVTKGADKRITNQPVIDTNTTGQLVLKGVVREQASGTPLVGISVILSQKDLAGKIKEKVVMTDHLGHYEIPISPDRIYEISFEHGFQQSRLLLSSRGRISGTILHNFYLPPPPLLAHSWR